MLESFCCPRLWAWSPVLGKPVLSMALEQPPAERRKSARGNAILTYTAEAGNGAGTLQQQQQSQGPVGQPAHSSQLCPASLLEVASEQPDS